MFNAIGECFTPFKNTHCKKCSRKGCQTEGDIIQTHTFKLIQFISCSIPPHLKYFLLAETTLRQPISVVSFSGRRRPSEDHWLNICPQTQGFHQIAIYWTLGLSFKSNRICKFCEDRIGTPRHYVMACTETKQYTEAICNAFETEIVKNTQPKTNDRSGQRIPCSETTNTSCGRYCKRRETANTSCL